METNELYQEYLLKGVSFTVQKKMLGYQMNKHDKVFNTVFYQSIQIFNSLEKLELIYSIIANIPSKDFFDKRGIMEDKYLRYHIENYYTTSISMLDKLSKLLNNVYQLEVDNCSFKKIINRKLDKLPQEIRLIVTQLDEDTADLRKYRNIIVHEEEFDDDEWFMLSGLSLMSKRDKQKNYNDQLMDEAKKAFSKYELIFDKYNNLLSKSVNSIFEYMAPWVQKLCGITINSSKSEVIKHVLNEINNSQHNNYA
jgi:hypothetical protein